MDSWRATLIRWNKNVHFRHGLPFLTLLVVGSFGLQRFAKLRYDVKKGSLTTEEEEKLERTKQKKPSSLEEEFEKYQSTTDLDKWENIRGPRPWEDSKTVQELQREAKRKLGH